MNEYFEVEDARPPSAAVAAPYGGAARKGQRALWLGVAAATALVTIAAIGWQQYGWLAAQKTTTTWTARHPVTAVEIYVTGGDLTVRPSGGDAVALRQTLTWTVSKPRVTESWQGDTLLITEDCQAPSFTVANPCGASLDLAVPAAVSVQSTIDSGSLTVKRMTGSVNARAQSGDIDLEDDTGTISARADSGEIAGHRLSAQQVNAQTLSGDVDLTFSSAPMTVSVSVASGSASVTVPRGTTYRVSGQTASGDRSIAAGAEDASSPRSIEIDSQSGDAHLDYPDDN